jgi:Tfp pilus assembly protein PilN
MMLAFETSTQILEIPETIQQEAWQQSQTIAPPGHRWQAYLNQMCLQTVRLWLQEKSGREPAIVSGREAAFWEMVNGSAVMLGDDRVVLIPIEDCDRREFRIPQEWIDIPDWVGDYYLAIEVDADEQMIYIWAYTTHQLIKTQGQYDAEERSYILASNDLIQDMTIFWVMQQLEAEPTRLPVRPLPELSRAPVENLIQRLSNAVIPRLEIPFGLWSALLEQQGQRLIEQRTGRSSVRLSQWLNNVFETGWQTLETFLSAAPELGFSLRRDEAESTIRRVKRLRLDTADVLLVVTVAVEADERRCIWVQLLPQVSVLPEQVRLSLISATGEVLQSAQSSRDSNYIQLRRFRCAIATEFQIEVTVGDVLIVEAFVS